MTFRDSQQGYVLCKFLLFHSPPYCMQGHVESQLQFFSSTIASLLLILIEWKERKLLRKMTRTLTKMLLILLSRMIQR